MHFVDLLSTDFAELEEDREFEVRETGFQKMDVKQKLGSFPWYTNVESEIWEGYIQPRQY